MHAHDFDGATAVSATLLSCNARKSVPLFLVQVPYLSGLMHVVRARAVWRRCMTARAVCCATCRRWPRCWHAGRTHTCDLCGSTGRSLTWRVDSTTRYAWVCHVRRRVGHVSQPLGSAQAASQQELVSYFVSSGMLQEAYDNIKNMLAQVRSRLRSTLHGVVVGMIAYLPTPPAGHQPRQLHDARVRRLARILLMAPTGTDNGCREAVASASLLVVRTVQCAGA